MPSTESIEPRGAGPSSAEENRATTLSAADLRKILKGVTSVLSDADEGHGAALDDLHERLESLGRAAGAARDKVPEEFAAAFERIEGGLGMLADRIAVVQADHRADQKADQKATGLGSAVAAASAAAAAVSMAAATPVVSARMADPIAVSPAPTSDTKTATVSEVKVPAPVASASAASAASHGAAPSTPPVSAREAAAAPAALSTSSGAPGGFSRAKLVPSTVDPFDVFDSTGDGAPGDPWNVADAEALTRVYEASGFAPAPRAPVVATPVATHVTAAAEPAAAPVDQASPAVTLKPSLSLMEAASAAALESAATATVTPAAPVAAPIQHLAPAIEREWLEARFAEIAARIEQSFEAMQSEDSLLALDERLGQFEERFGKVLDGIATRSDTEDLRQVETHLGELSGHVESAQLQLQRLDTIEAQLNAVMEKLSDQRLSSFIEEAGGRDIDVQAIARSAAEQVAARLGDITPASREGNEEVRRIEELRGLLNSFMAERRQGEEQTTGMLDTMQQAMIRLLDRVDSLELATTGAGDAYAPYDAPIADSPYAPAPVQAPAASPVAAQAARQMVLDDAEAVDVAPAAAARGPSAARAAAAPAAAAAATDGDAGPATSRDQLIAEARRAMIAAARQQQEEQQQAGGASAAKGKKPGKPGKVRKAEATENTGGISTTTRRILVGACTLLLLSSAVMLILPRKKATDIPPPKPFEQSTTGKASPSKGEAAPKAKSGDKGADAGAVIEGDGGEGGVAVASADAPTSEAQALSAPLPGMIVHRSVARSDVDAAQTQMTGGTSLDAAASVPTATAEVTGALPIETGALSGAGAAGAAAGNARVRPQDLPAAGVGPLSLRMAAAGGDPSAEFEVAARFAEGKGVPQDFAKAVDWYQRSADRGFAVAQYRLGTLYERGLGVSADPAKARAWYARAAETGNIKAMHNLAVLSASRERGSPDYTTASHWFQQAAERGLADSQYNIAVLYETGLGVTRDLQEAYKWFAIASRGGDKESKRRLELVKMKLDANGIVAADRLVAGWRPHAYDRIANDPFAAGQAWKQRAQTSNS